MRLLRKGPRLGTSHHTWRIRALCVWWEQSPGAHHPVLRVKLFCVAPLPGQTFLFLAEPSETKPRDSFRALHILFRTRGCLSSRMKVCVSLVSYTVSVESYVSPSFCSNFPLPFNPLGLARSVGLGEMLLVALKAVSWGCLIRIR